MEKARAQFILIIHFRFLGFGRSERKSLFKVSIACSFVFPPHSTASTRKSIESDCLCIQRRDAGDFQILFEASQLATSSCLTSIVTIVEKIQQNCRSMFCSTRLQSDIIQTARAFFLIYGCWL